MTLTPATISRYPKASILGTWGHVTRHNAYRGRLAAWGLLASISRQTLPPLRIRTSLKFPQ